MDRAMRGDGALVNYADWYGRGPYAEFVIERAFDGDRGVDAVLAQQPAGDFPDPETPELVLAQNVGTTGTAAFVDNGLARYRSAWVPGTIDFGLPGAGYDCTLERPHRGLFVAFDPNRLLASVDMTQRDFLTKIEPLLAQGVRDPFLSGLTLQLFAEMGRADDPGGLFVEGMLSMLTGRLQRLAQDMPVDVDPVPLSSREQVEILDYIDTHLDTDLRTAELAKIVRRPVSAFHRMFKATLGQTPHAFVLARRIERARNLLATTDTPISGIAYECGFSSQQHMTNAFSAKLGTSPGRYRRELRR